MIKNNPNKITATLKLVVTGEFYDDETSEETLRYWVEQDLEDAGFEVDVSMLKEQEPVEPIPPTDGSDLWKCGNCNHQLFRCTHQRYCEMCGRKVKWND